MKQADPMELAVRYLQAARAGEPAPREVLSGLAEMDEDELEVGLPSDTRRIAFWLDLYNGAVAHHPADISPLLQRWRRFRAPLVTVAGRRLSLDDMENGLLRRSRWKLGLGYLRNPLPSSFERRMRVERLDARVHFALNCGAVSCPPIETYRPEVLEEQLELATRSHLAAEVHERDEGVLLVPAFMFWYLGDFEGRAGIRRFLERYGIEAAGRRLRAAPYDWSAASGGWVGDER